MKRQLNINIHQGAFLLFTFDIVYLITTCYIRHMEYRRIWMAYETAVNKGSGWVEYRPNDSEQTANAENEIKALLADGWSIVSTAPVSGTVNVTVGTSNLQFIYTTGIEVFLVKK